MAAEQSDSGGLNDPWTDHVHRPSSIVSTPMDSSRASQSASSPNTNADSPAGIHCANPHCRTRAGERSRGHQSCRALLCGHCCQNAARAAAEAGEHRPICKVHARRVHTGHKPAPKTEHHTEGSLTSATAINDVNPTSGMAVPHTGDPEELHDLLDKRARLEQSLKRSLTMVIWYRNGCEPLRIAHEVTTFPLFQLQDFPELIGELGLQPSSYIDTYNIESGQWEQHKISTVRSVEHDQRLLYRLRPSLLDSLTDCPSLDQELTLQPPPKTLMIKRQPEPPTPSPPANKQVRVLSNSTPIRAPTLPSVQNTVVQSWDSPSSNASPGQGTSSWSLAAPSGASLPIPRTNPNSSIPTSHANSKATTSTENTKRWPTDYTVHEIVEGFDAMAAIMKSDTSARQKTAFERVFPPCRYVKSTVGRAKLYWKRASQEIRDHFLTLPRDDPRGKWTHFVHLMDGRLVIEVGKDKADETVEAGNETADEDDRANMTTPLNFTNADVSGNQPQISIQSSQNLTAHPSLPLTRPPPPIGALMQSHPSPLTHHASAPAMPMTTTFTLDRTLNMNRSSSSLSGAITIPEV